MVSTRKKISVISQTPLMLNSTIRNNLDPTENVTDTEIWNVLEQVGMKSLVENLSQKLQTPISGGNSSFSLGQRQLLHLAQVLLKQNKIIILDEATGKIDLKTDEQIQRIIRSHFKDCTVITIAHRLTTIFDCDRIMVLDQGEIVEFDRPQELLVKEDGLFRQLQEEFSKR